MKRIFVLILTALLLFSLCACGNTAPTENTEPKVNATAQEADVAKLDSLYAGRELRYGEQHAHADTGGKSDGKVTLPEWKEKMAMNGVDFATIVDHKQTIHMRLPEWDSSFFIGGSEAGCEIGGVQAEHLTVHYNMLFSTVEEFETVLNMYPVEFQYFNGLFKYPKWNVETLSNLSRTIYKNGGLLVHVHPCHDGYLSSQNPLDYFYGDVMGFEVFTGYHGDMTYPDNMKQYEMWLKLLDLGKRAYATCGSDSHGSLKNMPVSLGTIYSEARDAKVYLNYVRSGDFTAGPAGVRMAVGDTRMGGETSFQGQRLVLSAGQIHTLTYNPEHTYRVDLYSDTGLVFSEEITGQDPQYFAVDADPAVKYYHANIYDVTDDKIIAVGNPIWNSESGN